MALPLSPRLAESFEALRYRPRAGVLPGPAVRIDLSCLFGVVLTAWTVADLLSLALEERPALAYWTAGVTAATLLLASIALHEAAHCAAATKAGLVVRRVELSLFGGVTDFSGEPRLRPSVLGIALAGPLANFATAAGAAAVHVALVEAGVDPLVASVPAILAVGNLALALVNVVPAHPFDGGLVLQAALERLGWSEPALSRVMSSLGRGLGGLLLGFAVLASVAGDAAVALWSALIGFIITHHSPAANRSRS